MKSIAFMALFAMAAMPAASQTPAQKLAFEAASIKPAKANSDRSSGNCHGSDSKFPPSDLMAMQIPPLGRCVFSGATLHVLVRTAYGAEFQGGIDNLIFNEPSWMKSELFDVDAVAASPETTTRMDLFAMLRELLADRFKLQLHRDHKEVQGYALVVAKNGPKLKADTNGDEYGSFLPSTSTPFEWEGKNTRLSVLAGSLASLLQAPIVDKTGLAGRFNFILTYSPITAPNAVGQPVPRPLQDLPSIFEALPAQLGLRLQPEKESVAIIVIDSVQRPSEN